MARQIADGLMLMTQATLRRLTRQDLTVVGVEKEDHLTTWGTKVAS